MKIPQKSKLKSRISTINNSFVVSITPWVNNVSEEHKKEIYGSLKIKEGQCAYCLREATTSDHFYPLVKDKMPTGYITEPYNLAPACAGCNSSKGGLYWSEWYVKDKVKNKLIKLLGSEEKYNERLEILKTHDDFIKDKINKLDYQKILGDDWTLYLKTKDGVEKTLENAQTVCDSLESKIKAYLDGKNK